MLQKEQPGDSCLDWQSWAVRRPMTLESLTFGKIMMLYASDSLLHETYGHRAATANFNHK